jgi:hypothetical protein
MTSTVCGGTKGYSKKCRSRPVHSGCIFAQPALFRVRRPRGRATHLFRLRFGMSVNYQVILKNSETRGYIACVSARQRQVNVAPTGRLSPYPGREHSDANRDPGNESCNTIGRTVCNAAERQLHTPLVVATLPYTAASLAFSKVCSWRPHSNRRSGSHWANDIAHLG